MTEKIISFVNQRPAALKRLAPAELESPSGTLIDRFARPLHDLRISVTDRCNFRCVYCMPKQVFDKNYAFLPHTSLLSFEEITRLAKLFVAHGVHKIRLTGGEPLLRKNLEKLVAMLATIKTPDGRDLDLTLTTNGALLAKKAQALKDAGLRRVTVSLDALDDAIFKRMNDVDFAVAEVLHGIDVAHQVGLGPVKINMVVKGGMNDQEIVPMARHFKGSPSILRFIEYMDVGASNGWKMDEVIPSAEVMRRIDAEMPLRPVGAQYPGETAARWQYTDGSGEIGLISSVTQAFCQDCSRARLSTEGKLYTCLFASHGHDLRALLREHDSEDDSEVKANADAQISTVLAHLWRARDDQYSALRNADTVNPATATPFDPATKKIEMSYIGG